MRKLALLAVFLALPLAGCNKPSPAPAWAVTAPERTVGDILAAANAAVVKYEADVKAGVAGTDNTALKSVMTQIQQALVIAQPAYNTWNSALKANSDAAEPAVLVTSVSTLQNSLSQLPTQYKAVN
jgi:hypothetical protein